MRNRTSSTQLRFLFNLISALNVSKEYNDEQKEFMLTCAKIYCQTIDYDTDSSTSSFRFNANARSNSIRRETVTALASYGLTDDLLETWQPYKSDPRESFHEQESELLIYLVTGTPPASTLPLTPASTLPLMLKQVIRPLLVEQRLTPAQAITEINGLCPNQQTALLNCYVYGLRGDHLRHWVAGSSGFMYTHQLALTRLIQDHGVNPDTAIHMLDRKTYGEAWEIYRQDNIPSLSEPSSEPFYWPTRASHVHILCPDPLQQEHTMSAHALRDLGLFLPQRAATPPQAETELRALPSPRLSTPMEEVD